MRVPKSLVRSKLLEITELRDGLSETQLDFVAEEISRELTWAQALNPDSIPNAQERFLELVARAKKERP